jgi:hypothetical protein
MKISVETHQKMLGTISTLEADRLPWWQHWRDLSDYILPRRYSWLLSKTEAARRATRNAHILDSTGTNAARTLASGMMNGVTSPARPWFKLRVQGAEEADHELRIWLDEVERRILLIMAESNFYNAIAVLYLDLVIFGTGAMIIYEDYKNVIRCSNPALGEFYLGQDFGQSVNTFARTFCLKVHQVVGEFGEENCSEQVRNLWKQGGGARQKDVIIHHLIEPNLGKDGILPDRWAFREVYWEKGQTSGMILRRKGFDEIPGIFPRWELCGNDAYGTGPASDALADIIQLQQETKRKAQSLDKLVSPPMIASLHMQNRPLSLLPGGVTFAADINEAGAKPLYTVNPPLGEMTLDIRDVQTRIRETFFNQLFRDISMLSTVRSATEIDARQQEKLVLLGSVLNRFENEALDPAINRIFSISLRGDLLPPAPERFAGKKVEIQYVSILSTAQRAVGVAPLERAFGLSGNLSAVYPGVLNVLDPEEAFRMYCEDIGVPARAIKSREAAQQDKENQDKLQQQREGAAQGEALAKAGANLSKTEVGGGQNAVEMLLGA